MKTLLLFLFFPTPALAQLEKSLLEGHCGKVNVNIRNNVIRAEFPVKGSGKRICEFKIKENVITENPVPAVMLYLSTQSCAAGNISAKPFLKIESQGKYGQGVFSVYQTKKALHCQFMIHDWQKIKNLTATSK